MDYFRNLDKEMPGFLLRSFTVRKRMFGLLVPVALAGAWFVYPALTPSFKAETLGIVDTSNVKGLAAQNLSGMSAKDSLVIMSEDEE